MYLDEIKKAYSEAYEAETGNPIHPNRIDFESSEVITIIKLKNAIGSTPGIGYEGLGDIELCNKGEGWFINFKK